MTAGELSLLNYERVLTVASSSSHTDAVNIGGSTPVAIIVSTNTLVSTSITFEVAQGSTHTFYALCTSSGGAITVNTSTQAAQQYMLDHTKFWGAEWLKAVMATTSDVNKTLRLVTRPIS